MFLGGPVVQSGSEEDRVGRRDGPSTFDGETSLQSEGGGGGGLAARGCDIVFCMLEYCQSRIGDVLERWKLWPTGWREVRRNAMVGEEEGEEKKIVVSESLYTHPIYRVQGMLS